MDTLFDMVIRKRQIRWEKPDWAAHLDTIISEDITYYLPTHAYLNDFRLRNMEYSLPGSRDPVILYTSKGKIVYEWRYVPSLAEVFEVCQALNL